MNQKEKTIYFNSKIVKLNAQNINDYKKDIITDKVSRGRVCTHFNIDNSLHEMFIINHCIIYSFKMFETYLFKKYLRGIVRHTIRQENQRQ